MSDTPKKPGKRSVSEPVHMTFPKEVLAQLKKEAARRGMGYSTLTAQIVFEWLDARRNKGEAA